MEEPKTRHREYCERMFTTIQIWAILMFVLNTNLGNNHNKKAQRFWFLDVPQLGKTIYSIVSCEKRRYDQPNAYKNQNTIGVSENEEDYLLN